MNRQHSITIQHDMPGRLRLRIPGLGGDGTSARKMDKVRDTDGVYLVRSNPACAALVVRYDPKVLPKGSLLSRLRLIFIPHLEMAEPPAGNTACTVCAPSSPCNRDHGHNLRTELRLFSAITAVTSAVFVRTTLMGAVVAQTLLSPLGLVVAALSLPLAYRGLKDLKQGRPSIDSFLAGGILASVVGGQAVTALEILWINSGASLLSAWIAERSRKHISEILEITSHHTFVLIDGVEVEREVSQVKPGDVVVLHTGEKISVDGEIVHGQALLNEAPITGRQDFEHKRVGQEVFAGTFVREGVIQVRADKVGDSTYLSRVMHKVQDDLEHRAPIEGVADDLASRLVKIGVGATAATWLLTGSLWRAYTVLLVMACPCATILAASTAVSAAMNAAARNQILIKGGRYLEGAGKAKTVFFDKTGTLTTDEPSLRRFHTIPGISENDLLEMAASVETHNHHPLARAIMAEADRRGIEPTPHSQCDYHMGMGMRAQIGGDEVIVGNAKLAKLYKAPLSTLEKEAQSFEEQGLTVLRVYKNKTLQGIMGLAAKERPEAVNVIQRLRAVGVKRIVLITGDEEASARQLADHLGLDQVYASVMPEDKARLVVEEQERYGSVLMVGDGINDALALTKADVGVAFGTGGSEVAVEAADIALVKDDLEGLVSVYQQSQRTLRIAHENFWIATGSNLAGVVLGAMGVLTPVFAGLVHIGHSLGVLANSSRLLAMPRTSFDNPLPGTAHGLHHPSETEEIPEHKTPRSRQDPDQVQPGRVDRSPGENVA